MVQINPAFEMLIPKLTTEEELTLELSIVTEGCRDPIITWNDFIIDGHNRYRICTEHDIEYKTLAKEFESEDDAKIWMINNQFGRRNLWAFDRGMLALEMESCLKEIAKRNQIDAGKGLPTLAKADTRKEIANIAKVSHWTIDKIKKIRDTSSPETKELLKKWDVSINEVYQSIRKEEKKVEMKATIEWIRKSIEDGSAKLPEGKFEVMVIDPPRQYDLWYDPDGQRGLPPYPTMTQEQLKTLELPTANDCTLWLWTTQSFIWDAKELLEHRGFTYKAILVRDKVKMGLGKNLRMQCEFCLMGIKGKPIINLTNQRDIITESRREHSRKPDGFYEMVDSLCIGRKLDYFAREQREWRVTFGGEDTKF